VSGDAVPQEWRGPVIQVGLAVALVVAVLGPILWGLSTLFNYREADRKEISSLYQTIEGLRAYKDLVAVQVSAIGNNHERLRDQVLRIEAEQARRTSTVASVTSVDAKVSALALRFEAAQQRGVSSPADDVKELREQIRHLMEMRLKQPAKP
jgi:hypothetical protein